MQKLASSLQEKMVKITGTLFSLVYYNINNNELIIESLTKHAGDHAS